MLISPDIHIDSFPGKEVRDLSDFYLHKASILYSSRRKKKLSFHHGQQNNTQFSYENFHGKRRMGKEVYDIWGFLPPRGINIVFV